jgi:hypothetical protein
VQLALIVAAFVIAAAIVTFVLNMLDQPPNTPNQPSGTSPQLAP